MDGLRAGFRLGGRAPPGDQMPWGDMAPGTRDASARCVWAWGKRLAAASSQAPARAWLFLAVFS